MTARPLLSLESRGARLKMLTHDTHERLDRSVTAAAAFASREGFARFALAQWRFHRDIDILYGDAALRRLLPGADERRRLPLLRLDLADLCVTPPPVDAEPVFAAERPVDMATALGWLYVAEGSRMGAALLRKEAAKLGLSDAFGARHLAPAPEGPATQWRAFVAALDAVALPTDAEPRVTDGAVAAFTRMQAYVDQQFA